jgi:hypothetical protein
MKIGELFLLETIASMDSAMVVAVLEFWAVTKVSKQTKFIFIFNVN